MANPPTPHSSALGRQASKERENEDTAQPPSDNGDHAVQVPATSPLPSDQDASQRSLTTSTAEDSLTENSGIRSMYSERVDVNQHRHLEVKLRSAQSLVTDEADSTPSDPHESFVDGDFCSGKVQSIPVPDGCWVMAFSRRASILAIGLPDKIEFRETINYTPTCHVPRKAKVSAIAWCLGSALDSHVSAKEAVGEQVVVGEKVGLANQGDDENVIAVAGLDGHVAVYQLDASMMEFKGVQTLHEIFLEAQVRCMALKPMGEGRVLLAVGDKLGKVTLTTLYRPADGGSVLATFPETLDFDDDAVLGLDCHVLGDKPVLVVGTKSGRVVAHELVTMDYRGETNYLTFGPKLWNTKRNGSVRAVQISKDGKHLSFGGYDKTVVRVDLELWAIVREFTVQGTVNMIGSDPLERFLVVGCRDKSVTFYDQSTFFPLKRLPTPGWVTSVSWGVPGLWSDIVAIRTQNTEISLIDMTPIHMTDVELSTTEGFGTSVSWSPCGEFLARISGDMILISNARLGFMPSAKIRMAESTLWCLSFSPQNHDRAMYLAAVGLNGHLYVMEFEPPYKLRLLESTFVEENLWAVGWSSDGKSLAVGGKGKTLTLFSMKEKLLKRKEKQLDGRIWGVEFLPKPSRDAEVSNATGTPILAVASGDYKTIFFDDSLDIALQILRSRTVRCLDMHPRLAHVAMGDGAGTVAIVNYEVASNVHEFEMGGRVNVLKFSPTGDFLLVGSDDCSFTIHETTSYTVVQEIPRGSFATSAAFSPSGKYLALGSTNEPYTILRLGPLLGIDLVPLDGAKNRLLSWAMQETLFRSGFGPSLLQRHMMSGSHESLLWLTNTLKEFPDAVYTINRLRGEGCLDTALRLKKIKVLQEAVKPLLDGSLEKGDSARRSVLTTNMPNIGRRVLEAMVTNYPAELLLDLLESLTFVKVPFTKPHVVTGKEDKMVCGSCTYLDPWKDHPLMDYIDEDGGTLTRTPAVLPIPGLGSMYFLSMLVARAPATAFDNEAMGIVIRVMWQGYIRKFFLLDTGVFLLYYGLWIFLVEQSAGADVRSRGERKAHTATALIVLILNSIFAFKELVQSDLGHRPGYFFSGWNQVDLASIILVYIYASMKATPGSGDEGTLVSLAVFTTLVLTIKLISYLRAFNQTGWLVTVLSRNFWDVRGFLVVLLAILVGFSASFRILFATSDPPCELELEDETGNLVQDCLGNPFGSLRRAILSTFEMTILGTYEPSLLAEGENVTLAIIVFVLAVTSVLVVALNALISLLADSYARVQEDATANERKEKAELIVEYMALIPSWRRRRIEDETQYFHALLESDAGGDLVVEDDDWHGGLNALRDDLDEICKTNTDLQLKAVEALRTDLEKEVTMLRDEVLSKLRELSADMKEFKKNKSEGALSISGKRVAGAVKAVKDIGKRGTSLFQSTDADR